MNNKQNITNLSYLFKLEREENYKKLRELLENFPKNLSEIQRLNLHLLKQRIESKDLNFNYTNNIDIKWSAIITVWKRKEYLKQQIKAIKEQTIPPYEIIVIKNENFITEEFIKSISSDIKIIQSEINSLYLRFACSYIANGNYICIFDDDVIPGELWIANAIRACENYNALVVPRGRIYNKAGKYNFFKSVQPSVTDKNCISCSNSDIFCDWGCNSYFFKREWVGYILSSIRYKNSFKTYDDIQLATSLFIYASINCVVPMQPDFDDRFNGNIENSYGNDDFAVWKTNSNEHFFNRKNYIEHLIISEKYIPVQQRDQLTCFHIIIPFGERLKLERCLLSIKGQTYKNFTCTLIDDCCDGNSSLSLLNNLNIHAKKITYIRTKNKSYPLRSREIASDLLKANLADVIIHLDGDDWLSSPDVLSRLNKIYRRGDITVTYGNALSLRNVSLNNFKAYSYIEMSKKWNVAQEENTADILPFEKIDEQEIKKGWEYAPWCAYHVRTFKFVNWIRLNKMSFINKKGEYLRSATDAAILIPILNNCSYNSIAFIPEINYIYQNAGQTIHAKNEISLDEQKNNLLNIKNSNHNFKNNKLINILSNKKINNELSYLQNIEVTNKFNDYSTNIQKNLKNYKSGIVTIVSTNHLSDAILCLSSYKRNLDIDCSSFIFVTTRDNNEIDILNDIFSNSSIHILFPHTLKFTNDLAKSLENKYHLYSDEYRWGMKSVLLIELLNYNLDLTIFLDPDIYTVSNISDMHNELINHDIAVFPHFRSPDNDYLRKVLYKDGFFNGGMLAATLNGISNLKSLFFRCLKNMKKDPEKNLWDDQKYYDYFTFEVENLFINLDRGINYNPWNHEPVEGLISPSQCSYLLKSGYFIRIWHMSTQMIKNSIEQKDQKFIVYRFIVSIYLLSIQYINLLTLSRISIYKSNTSISQQIINRIYQIKEQLNNLNIKLLDQYLISNTSNKILNYYKYIDEITNLICSSICFDNFKVFSLIIKDLFAKIMPIDNLIDKLNKLDLRYISEDILGDVTFTDNEISKMTETKNIGSIVKNRIKILHSSNITF